MDELKTEHATMKHYSDYIRRLARKQVTGVSLTENASVILDYINLRKVKFPLINSLLKNNTCIFSKRNPSHLLPCQPPYVIAIMLHRRMFCLQFIHFLLQVFFIHRILRLTNLIFKVLAFLLQVASKLCIRRMVFKESLSNC